MSKPVSLLVASIVVFARAASAQPALPGGEPPPAAVAAPADPPPDPGPGPPPPAARPVPTVHVAAPPAPPPSSPQDPCPEPTSKTERGARMTGGIVSTQDVPLGAYGRLELEEYTLPGNGFIMGILLGMEGWGSEAGGGGGLPFIWYMGFQEHRSLFATLGFGIDWAIYDRVRDIGGFGIFAPEAAANVGLDFEGVRILADGRAQYRWEWGARDRYQLKAGLTISITTDH